MLEFPREVTEQNPLRSAWEAVPESFAGLLEDGERERVATRIPIVGTVRDPEADFWSALGAVLRNAFIETLPAQLEGSVGEG